MKTEVRGSFCDPGGRGFLNDVMMTAPGGKRTRKEDVHQHTKKEKKKKKDL